ncbi:hypothetical protein RHGRI_024452 [Rhododendron griersonianum]|uniref:Thioesterase domain-containing protein n=1 Tax=Rhododendron griersonianum TaxID=479676 RepID=A0AAV6JCR4_9ERIC|nr:hypothetical protein RHGRI_024452 [Rhododendron griersonianum]
MEMGSETLSRIARIIQSSEDSNNIPPQFDSKYFHSHLIRGLLRTHRVERGRLSSLLSVKPPVMNIYGILHGGAVVSVAEIMSIACARTVVGEDKELFLGELICFPTAFPFEIGTFLSQAELTVDASVIRSGRSLTVIAVEFKVKDTGKLVYTSHATFYNTPVASL